MLKTLLYNCQPNGEAYGKILQNERYENGEYDEDILRNDLVKHLEINKKQLKIAVAFRKECSVIDKDAKKTKGRIDISVIHDLSLTSDYDITFECKRLKNNDKNQKYVDDGLMDFINGKYAEKMPFAGMIGFVEEGNISVICADIKSRIENNGTNIICKFIKEKIVEDFDYSYKSNHKRINNLENISLYHLIFDYTEIIK
jgi:hypothetical protein